jgi:GNAT superfamily N-acetyltransferase
MAEINVRLATTADLPQLQTFDPGYSTESVWQMDLREDATLHQTMATFRRVRLPRPLRVNVPRDPQRLADLWQRRACFLVAEEGGGLKGYVCLTFAPAPATAWVADGVVERRARRLGVGSVLLASAMHWAQQNHMRHLILETTSKNYPAICFAQKHGLAFCGYNDRYYANQDVALFFGALLK